MMIIWVVSGGQFVRTIIFFVQTMEANISSCVAIIVTVIEFGVWGFCITLARCLLYVDVVISVNLASWIEEGLWACEKLETRFGKLGP